MRDENPVSSQKSKFYYIDMVPSIKRKITSRDTGLYTHEFIEDVYTSIMPYQTGDSGGVDIKLPSGSAELEKKFARILSQGQYHLTFSEAVEEFVRQCAHALLAFETAEYEIVYYSDETSGDIKHVEFVPIPPGSLRRKFGKVFQEIPDRQGAAQYVELDEENLLSFDIPRPYKSLYRGTIAALAWLGNHLLADVALREDHKRQIAFDSNHHIESQKLALAAAGKAFGWNARGLFESNILDYYFVHRHLHFRQFVIELRDHILSVLNIGIRKVGPQFDYSGEINISGLPTTDDVRQALEELRTGTKSFSEILKPFAAT